jgi:hypothetical protein
MDPVGVMRKEQLELAIRQCLSGDMALDDFREWFAGAYVQVRQDPNVSHEASQLCSQIVGPLAEFSRGHRSEDSLRKAMEILIPASKPEHPVGNRT